MPQEAKINQLFTYNTAPRVLDETNIRIISELQREPRLTMSELGRRIGMSSPAVTERVRSMEDAKVIRGFRVELDPAALGLPICAYVRVRPGPGRLSRVAQLAQQIPEIVECHRVTGEDCFIIKVHIPAIDQLDRLLDCFLEYGSTTTLIVQSSPVPLRPLPLPEPPSHKGLPKGPNAAKAP